MHTDRLSIYQGRRILLTGHTGFKGSWLAMWLHSLGAEVMGVSLAPSGTPSMYGVLRLNELVREHLADIRDFAALRAAVHDFAPEMVFHLAAQALVRPSYQFPLETLDTNIMGTAHVLEACRLTPSVRAVVIITSDKCYRNNEQVWGYRENDPMGGHDPYSVSKGCAELVTDSYVKSYFPPEKYADHHVAVASARAGNVIGGGDWAVDRIIPDCIRALGAGREIHIRSPYAIRPWQHVLESLSGYLLLGSQLWTSGPAFAGGWNFAPLDRGDIWPVERIVKHMCALWGNGRYVVDNLEQPHEAAMLCLDATKAALKLGWKPRYTVREAIEQTVVWYRQYLETPDTDAMRALTLRQIQDYAATSRGEEAHV